MVGALLADMQAMSCALKPGVQVLSWAFVVELELLDITLT